MEKKTPLTVKQFMERLGVSRKVWENLGTSGKEVLRPLRNTGLALAKVVEKLQGDERVRVIARLAEAQEVVDQAIRAQTKGKWGYLDLIKRAELAEKMRPDARRGRKIRQTAAKGGREKSENFGYEKRLFLHEAKRIQAKQPHLSKRSVAKLAVDLMICKHDIEISNVGKKVDSLRKYL